MPDLMRDISDVQYALTKQQQALINIVLKRVAKLQAIALPGGEAQWERLSQDPSWQGLSLASVASARIEHITTEIDSLCDWLQECADAFAKVDL